MPGLPDIIDTPMGLVMAIEYKLKAADGSLVSQQIHKTIHRVAGDRVSKDKSVHRDHLIASSATPTNIQEPERTFESEAIDLSGARVVDLKSTGITLSYDVTEIRMKLGERLVIRYHNASEMSHNVVVVKEEADIQPVGIAALSAMADGFIPQTLNPRAYSSQEQDRILAASRLAYPGDTVLLEFTPDNAGVYPYICTYSGHFTMMQGRIHVEP
jgi:azurin